MNNNKILRKYSFFTIIVLFMTLVTPPIIAQEYEYADEEYADGEYEYADEEYEYVDDEYEYADGEYEYVDGEYEYADGEYEYADGEYEYADEELKTIINIPLYKDYRLPMAVDPKNPKLPANHNLAKLRGTIWRGDDVVIRTNERGVLAEYRPFIFFDANEDSIAYKYVPVGQQKLPEFPRTHNYIVLNPLLKTNNYVPAMVAQAKPLGTVALDNRIKFVVNPLLLNNQSYEAALEKMRLQAEENRKSKDFTTVTTNIGTIVQEPDPSQLMVITTNRTMTIITNIIQNELIQIQDIPSMQRMFNGSSELPIINTSDIQEDDFFSTDQYPSYTIDPENLYDAYADNQFGSLNFLPLKMIAQDMNQSDLADDQYVINVGERNSGIFIHKTDDIKDPYKVIFLALDEAMNLYEYNTGTTFDVRDPNSNVSQKARELYIKILDEKINMKKFQKVRVKNTYLD